MLYVDSHFVPCALFLVLLPPLTHFLIQFSCLVFPSCVQLPSLPFFVYIVVFSLVFLSVCFHVPCGFLINVPVLILCGSFLDFMLQTVLLLWGFVFLPCVLCYSLIKRLAFCYVLPAFCVCILGPHHHALCSLHNLQTVTPCWPTLPGLLAIWARLVTAGFFGWDA